MAQAEEGECVDGKLACPNCGVNLKVKTVLTAVAAAQIKEEVDTPPLRVHRQSTHSSRRQERVQPYYKGTAEKMKPSMEESSTPLTCSTVRIGSYRCIPKGRVIVSKSGIKMEVPLPGDNMTFVSLEVEFKDIIKVLVHFGKAMPALFIYTTTNAGGMIRELLRMQDPKGPYYDPTGKDHTHKRITLLPKVINEESKLILKTLFAPNDLLAELNNKEANDILVKATPKDLKLASSKHDEEVRTNRIHNDKMIP